MYDDTHEGTGAPEPGTGDVLTEVLRRGARELLRQAVEAELRGFLDEHAERELADGRRAVVRRVRGQVYLRSIGSRDRSPLHATALLFLDPASYSLP